MPEAVTVGRAARLLGGSLRVGVAEATAAKAEMRATDFIVNWLIGAVVEII